ncbi:glycosyltransferase [Knoellia sp. CPCC 206435]|uniref:glycosyltransferase n=1 Tax=Knoellia terrae TaxID=3404797 RepID=UPI003B43C28C
MTVRVLHLVASTQRRGAEIFATRLSRHLTETGCDSQVLAIAASRTEASLDLDTLVQGSSLHAGLVSLRRAMRQVDVVVAHGSRTLPYSVLAGVGTRVPIIYKSIGDPWYWARTRSRRWRTTALLSRVQRVAALSPGAARAIEQCWRVPASRIVVTGNGRDPRTFAPATPWQRRQAREALALDDAAVVVLGLGALSPEKRPDLAIKVAQQVPEATFLFAGEGPLAGVMASGIDDPERLRLLGGRRNVVELLHAADILLSTSDSEGLPGAIVEAALCGLASVATRAGFTADVVVDGVTGVLTATGDVEALVAGVRAVMREPRSMGDAARTHAAAAFDERDVFDRWRALVESVGGAAIRDG